VDRGSRQPLLRDVVGSFAMLWALLQKGRCRSISEGGRRP
jgi:hypothetical protein